METPTPSRKLKIALLVDTQWLFINTVQEYIEAFDLYSKHDIEIFSTQPFWWNDAVTLVRPLIFDDFDVLLIHYSARPCTGTTDPAIDRAIREFPGFTAMMLQDEYEFTARSIKWIRDHKINHVFTVVPERYIEKVYPAGELPGVTLTSILTGYVPIALERSQYVRPIEDRKNLIAYRGRPLAFQYGDLAQEKSNIGKHVRAVCERRGLPVDIEWTEEKRIYGRDWNDFLQSARATLGTESGSNVFDMDGSIAKAVNAALKRKPSLTYEEVRGRLFTEENIGVKMNQISPKFFEFIAARTALILFEGEYSGVLVPHRHYFPLKKDYSNLNEILDKLSDIPLLKEMTDRAYEEVVGCGRFGYRKFVEMIDGILQKHAGKAMQPLRDEALPTKPPPTRQMTRIRELRKSSVAETVVKYVQMLHDKKENFALMIERRATKIANLKAKMERRGQAARNTA
jgi:hypothetical protein